MKSVLVIPHVEKSTDNSLGNGSRRELYTEWYGCEHGEEVDKFTFATWFTFRRSIFILQELKELGCSRMFAD